MRFALFVSALYRHSLGLTDIPIDHLFSDGASSAFVFETPAKSKRDLQHGRALATLKEEFSMS